MIAKTDMIKAENEVKDKSLIQCINTSIKINIQNLNRICGDAGSEMLMSMEEHKLKKTKLFGLLCTKKVEWTLATNLSGR